MAEKKSFFAKFWFELVFALILLVGTVIFMLNGGEFDRAITEYFYDRSLPVEERFYLQNTQPFVFFNEYNGLFTYLLAAIFITMIVMGLVNKKKYGFLVKYGVFGFLAVLIGAGLFVNVIFKGMWGRPRPRHTYLWPTSENAPLYDWYALWSPAWYYDSSLIGEGVSFPSGHVSAVAIYIVFYYIFRNPHTLARIAGGNTEKKAKLFTFLKYLGLFVSIVCGILTGFGRIVVGAHHASDVLWAFGMDYLVTFFLYYIIFKFPKFEKKYEN